MNGVIYARYSMDRQREESIEGQLREDREYAERNGIRIVDVYIDRAYSAKTDNRPEFQRMIKDSAKGLFEVVIVWKLDRFARNRYDSAHYKALLRKHGVKVASATENISQGSEGIILEAMLEGFAEYFSADLAEKVSRGMTENALKCQYNGGSLPMGYCVDKEKHFQLDPVMAPIVLEMFTLYDKGATMQQLVDILKDRGIRSARGGNININTISKMLHNRRYTGEYRYRDIITPGGIPLIVPEDLFDRVQERLEKNRQSPGRHKAQEEYLLTTKLFCGKCGSLMVGESGTSHTGKIYRYYKCATGKRKKQCDKKPIQKDWIEDIVIERTMDTIMCDTVLESIIDTLMEMQTMESTAVPILKRQLAEAEKAIENLLNAIQQGILTASTKQRLEKLEEEKSQIEVKIIQEEIRRPMFTREQVTFFIYRFRKLDVTKKDQRQRLIDSFVNAVYVYEDRLVLTFNYKDGSNTVTLKDIESSDLHCLGIFHIKNRTAFLYGFLYEYTKEGSRTEKLSTS